MIRSILIKFSNMKLRNQLILLASMQIVIIVSFVFALNIIHFHLLKNIFSSHSDQIFKENSNQIQSNIMQMERRYLERVFYLNGNSLITFHRLYHATKKQVMENTHQINNNFQMCYGGTTQIPDPLRIIQGYGNFDISYSFMCYSNLSAYNNPKTKDELIGIKMQEQIQSYGQLIQIGKSINQYFIYSYIVKEKLTSIYPCLNRKQEIHNYKPEERDWYIELKRNYDSKQIYDSYNYSFTKPFQLFTEKKMGLSTAMPIVDENLQIIGGVGSIFLGNEFMKSINQTESGLQKIAYLISDDGIMIMHPFKIGDQFQKLYIYNESITGFNYTDWLEIKSNFGQSSCPVFAKYQSHLKCRFNSLYQQEMIIGIHFIQEFNMILITLLSSYEYLQFYREFQEQLKHKFQNIENIEIFLLIGLFVVACGFIYIFTQLLFYPLKLLQGKTLNKIKKTKYIMKVKIPNLSEYLMSEQIRQLSQAFKFFENKLDMLSFIKTTQCCEIESIKFPKKQYQYRFNSSGYSRFLQNGTDIKKIINQNSELFDIRAILKLLHKTFHHD